MNLGKKPAAGKGLEAQAEDLSPRGAVREYVGKEFPPGEWVKVTEKQAKMLQFKGLKFRQREGD